jgi:hypothetical protein
VTLARELLHVHILLIFVSTTPLRVEEAVQDPDWVLAMQEELNNFKKNEVWR